MEQAFNLSQKVEEKGATTSALVTPGTEPESLLARYCNHLDLPPNFQRICADIIGLAREHGIAAGRSPVSIAGGAIFFVCHLLGHPKSSKEISGVAGTSEGTIKLVYRHYYQDKEKIVPSAILESGERHGVFL
jgi:transcription initiation factor TFIIB